MKSKHLVIYILLFAIAVISACAMPATEAPAPSEAVADVESADASETEAGSNSESKDNDTDPNSPLPISPMPEPAAEVVAPVEEAPKEEAPVIEAEYDAVTGAVTGLLRARHEDGDIRPLTGAVIGLGVLIDNDEGEGKVGAAYSPSDSPRATIKEDGTFVINNIEPAEYALILDAVVSQSLMSTPDGSGDFFVTVEAGEQLDLEILEYETLSYPGFVNN